MDNKVVKRSDDEAQRSAKLLVDAAERRMKKIFVTALRCVEIRFGKEFDGYGQLRAEILRIGNDMVREFREEVEAKYNVEVVPGVIKIDDQRPAR